MNQCFKFFPFAAIMFLIMSCSSSSQQGTSTPSPQKSVSVESKTENQQSSGPVAIGSGSIVGTVKFEGEVPVIKTIEMSADPKCKEKHTTEVKSETLVLGDGNTLANIFVRVKSGLVAGQTYTAPSDPVVINQLGCMYVPHVIAAMKNQPVKVLNSDGTLHNVHGLPVVNKEFNVAMPAFKKEIEQVFDQVEESPFGVKCDVHPWMAGYISVMSHPFFSVTKQDGKFEIKDLPVGEYEIEVWHEKLPAQTAKIKVSVGGVATQDFTFKKPDQTALNAIMIVH